MPDIPVFQDCCDIMPATGLWTGCFAAGYLLGCGTVTVQLIFGFTPA
jgi:uncharacterized membrane protein